MKVADIERLRRMRALARSVLNRVALNRAHQYGARAGGESKLK